MSRPVENSGYSTTQSPNGYSQSRQISEEPSYTSYHKSSYQASNPGKQPPVPYNQSGLRNGQYYQQIVHQNMSNPGIIEDVVIKKTAAPGPGMGHLGLPGGNGYSVTDTYLSQEETMTPEHRIDPSLIAQDHGMYSDDYLEHESMYLGGNLDGGSQWPGPYGKVDRGLYHDPRGFNGTSHSYNGLQLHDQQLQMLKGNPDGWSVEPLDVGQEFDKWMDEV
jgi:hypothetical protein